MRFVILVCAVVAAWLIGYGMGYRRGATDAIAKSIPKADHRFNGE